MEIVNSSLVLVLVIISTICDLKTNKIFNKLLILFVFIGLIINIIFYGFNQLLNNIFGLFVPILLLMIFYILRMLGAGDIKLFSTIGSIMGWRFIINDIILSFLFGGIICFIIILIKRNIKMRIKYIYNYLISIFLSGRILEYMSYEQFDRNDALFHFSIAISLGTLATIFKINIL